MTITCPLFSPAAKCGKYLLPFLFDPRWQSKLLPTIHCDHLKHKVTWELVLHVIFYQKYNALLRMALYSLCLANLMSHSFLGGIEMRDPSEIWISE